MYVLVVVTALMLYNFLIICQNVFDSIFESMTMKCVLCKIGKCTDFHSSECFCKNLTH